MGIVRVGGLGHLAIQFAKGGGYTVEVYSSTDSKKEDAFKLGADKFYTTKGIDKLELPGVAGGEKRRLECHPIYDERGAAYDAVLSCSCDGCVDCAVDGADEAFD